MANLHQRSQFSLKTVLGIFMFVAVVCGLFTSACFEAILPGCAVFALFTPMASWLIASITRSSYPKLPRRLHLASTLYTTTVLVGFCFIYDVGILLVAVPIMLVLWLPQMLFVAFFEWCEHEERIARKQQEAR